MNLDKLSLSQIADLLAGKREKRKVKTEGFLSETPADDEMRRRWAEEKRRRKYRESLKKQGRTRKESIALSMARMLIEKLSEVDIRQRRERRQAIEKDASERRKKAYLDATKAHNDADYDRRAMELSNRVNRDADASIEHNRRLVGTLRARRFKERRKITKAEREQLDQSIRELRRNDRNLGRSLKVLDAAAQRSLDDVRRALARMRKGYGG